MKTVTFILLFVVTGCIVDAQVSNNTMITKMKATEVKVRTTSTAEKLEILIFGNGGLRSSVTGENGGENLTTGSLGASFILKGRTELRVGYTINSLKTITIGNIQDYGNNLLIPDLEGQSFTLGMSHFFTGSLGVYGEVLIANSKWKINNVDYGASPVALKLGMEIAPFGNIVKGDNFISFTFNAGYSNRSLIGTLANKDDIRDQYIGTKLKTFHGIEAGASLLINQTKVSISAPFFFSKESIDGLTGGQIVFGVTISGDLLKL